MGFVHVVDDGDGEGDEAVGVPGSRSFDQIAARQGRRGGEIDIVGARERVVDGAVHDDAPRLVREVDESGFGVVVAERGTGRGRTDLRGASCRGGGEAWYVGRGGVGVGGSFGGCQDAGGEIGGGFWQI